MNIPNHIHFGLGFGFKYQYLLSTLLHALITGKHLLSDKNKNDACQKYMIKKLSTNPSIHANVRKFMENIETIFPDIERLTYKKDALILLEGEDSCFEDFNMFSFSLNERFLRNGIETTLMYIDKAVMRLLLNLFLYQFKAGVLPHTLYVLRHYM